MWARRCSSARHLVRLASDWTQQSDNLASSPRLAKHRACTQVRSGRVSGCAQSFPRGHSGSTLGGISWRHAGIWPLSAFPALVLASCDDPNKYQAPPPAEVGVQKPQQRRVTLYLELTGNTSAFNKVDLVARVQGFLEKVGYKDGDRVAAGTTLFQIERAAVRDEPADRGGHPEAAGSAAGAGRGRPQSPADPAAAPGGERGQARRKPLQARLHSRRARAGQGPGAAGQDQPRLHRDQGAVRGRRHGEARRSRLPRRRGRADQARDHRPDRSDLRQFQRQRAAGAADPRAAAQSGPDDQGPRPDPGRSRVADGDGLSAHRHDQLHRARSRPEHRHAAGQGPARQQGRGAVAGAVRARAGAGAARCRIPAGARSRAGQRPAGALRAGRQRQERRRAAPRRDRRRDRRRAADHQGRPEARGPRRRQRHPARHSGQRREARRPTGRAGREPPPRRRLRPPPAAPAARKDKP